MKDIRRRISRFFLRNRDKGIPNLMLYMVLGTGLVYLMNLVNGGSVLYQALAFDKARILQGEVWRLVSWLLTEQLSSNPFLNILFLYFFYRLGRMVESAIGTFKFNLFYLAGVLLMDTFAMIFCPVQDVIIGQYMVSAEYFSSMYSTMAFYLHLSLVLAFATAYPDSRFYIFFIIPISAWVMALVYLVLIAISVYNMCYPVNLMPHALFPLVGLLNYFLFFGSQMSNLLPMSWRAKMRKAQRPQPHSPRPQRSGTIQFPGEQNRGTPQKADFIHRCHICGRTDVSNPELEFRYCSHCRGYHCYCQEHISNHDHVTQ